MQKLFSRTMLLKKSTLTSTLTWPQFKFSILSTEKIIGICYLTEVVMGNSNFDGKHTMPHFILPCDFQAVFLSNFHLSYLHTKLRSGLTHILRVKTGDVHHLAILATF